MPRSQFGIETDGVRLSGKARYIKPSRSDRAVDSASVASRMTMESQGSSKRASGRGSSHKLGAHLPPGALRDESELHPELHYSDTRESCPTTPHPRKICPGLPCDPSSTGVPMSINRVTGLREELIPELGVPRVQQKSPRAIKFGGQARAVHEIPVSPGVSMQLYSKLSSAEALVVVFASPSADNQSRQNSFTAEVKALRGQNFALVVVSDPTLQLHSGLRKGWHLGGPNFDPVEKSPRRYRPR